MGRRRNSANVRESRCGRPEARHAAQEGRNRDRDRLGVLPRRPVSYHGTHQQPKIETGHVHQQPLQDVPVSAQVRSAHASGVEVVLERPLEQFPTRAQQPLAAFTTNSPPVGVHRPLLPVLVFPLPATPLRFRYVRPSPLVLQISHRLVAVIPLSVTTSLPGFACIFSDASGSQLSASSCSCASFSVSGRHCRCLPAPRRAALPPAPRPRRPGPPPDPACGPCPCRRSSSS